MVTTAVILAAGKGTRLRPYTFEIPKGFMKVGPETLIERSIRILRENGIKNIFIACGHLAEKYEEIAEKHDLELFYNYDYDSTGSFYTLCEGRGVIKDDFLLLESDLLYDSKAISSLQNDSREDIILMSGYTHSSDEVFVELSGDGCLNELSKKNEDLDHIDGELVGIWKISEVMYSKLVSQRKSVAKYEQVDYEIALAQMVIKSILYS